MALLKSLLDQFWGMSHMLAFMLTERLTLAQGHLAEGRTKEAYAEMLALLQGPNPLQDASLAREALGLLAALSEGFGASEVAGRLHACALQPDNAQALFDAGCALYEEQQFTTAAAVLYRCNQLAPAQPPVVTELASCLEREMRYGEAALLVDLSGLAEHDPICTYLSGFSWLMNGERMRARERARQLSAHSLNERTLFMLGALDGMLTRADALERAGIALDDLALTAWHAALSGSLLLHESPHGYPEPMRGRYAFVQDSASLKRLALERLRVVLEAIGEHPPRVIAAPDRASHILALATAGILGIACEPWRESDERPGLFVAWRIESVESDSFLRILHTHRPKQRLFVHASSWTEPFVYSPDFTSLLHQHIAHPWTGGALCVDQATGQLRRSEPDTRSDEELAEEIIAAPMPEPGATPAELVVSVARALAPLAEAHAAGAFRSSGHRLHQRAGGPVQSSRF